MTIAETICLQSSTFELRRLQNNSGSSAVRHVLRTLPSYFGDKQAIPWYSDQASAVGNFSLGAYFQSRQVGIIVLRSNTDDTGEIAVLAIVPEHQSIGLGAVLLQRAEKEAIKRGHKCVIAATVGPKQKDPNFMRTLRFYERHNYKMLAEFDYMWSDVWCAYLVKQLDP
jgi:GNAT superfamily N-acetyltransferase